MKPEISANQLFEEIERPLLRALKALAPNYSKVCARWVELLERALISPGEAEAFSGLLLDRHHQHLERRNFEAFKLAIERHSHELVNRGISEDHAVLALGLYLESCLAVLSPADKEYPKMARALARLTAAAQLFLSLGYAAQRAAGWRSLDEQERHRLSRDLHDDIGHSLVVLKLYLEMMAMDLQKGSTGQISEKLAEATTLVSQAIQSVRRLILDLGPAILEEVGFVAALKLYARQFQTRTDIKVTFQESAMPAKIPSNYETALYRVVQGALSNVVKHASAKNVKITLGSVRDSVLVMIIEDDGAGFAVATKKPHQAFGISAMRERVQSLGGRFHIESTPGVAGRRGGTRIEVDLPVPRSEAS